MESMAAAKEEEKKKRSRGRRKIPIERIEDRDRRDVAYTKRRKGLFGKAAELCAAYGAQVAVLAFSPGHRIFAFGHPSFDVVLRRFLLGRPRLLPGDGLQGRAEEMEEAKRLVQLAMADERALEPDGGEGLEKLQREVEEMEETRRLVLAKLSDRMRKREEEEEAIREASIAMMKDFGVATGTLADIPVWARD